MNIDKVVHFIFPLVIRNLPEAGEANNSLKEGDREKYMELGRDEYLIKPVKKKDFCRILDLFFVQE